MTEGLRQHWIAVCEDMQQRNLSRHAYLCRLLERWYGERATPEDCCVCWETMVTFQDMVVPHCGHFLCKSCHDQCALCPVCRDAFQTPSPPPTPAASTV
jgi:hypothetical protein